MLCLFFAIFVGSMQCEEPPRTYEYMEASPSPTASATPAPDLDRLRRESSDGKSIWEAKWERMTGESVAVLRRRGANDDLEYNPKDDPMADCPRGFFNEDDEFIPFSAERREEMCPDK